MQKESSLSEGVRKITFGITPSDGGAILSFLLTVMLTVMLTVIGIGALVICYYHSIVSVLLYALIAFGILFGIAMMLDGRKSLRFDFEKHLYFISDGPGSSNRSRGGSFSDIRCISLTRDLRTSIFSEIEQIEFHPEAARKTYRLDMDNLPCTVSAPSIFLYLALATCLIVRVLDSSGWNASHPPVTKPDEIIVLPGETHPALPQPPPAPRKRNTW